MPHRLALLSSLVATTALAQAFGQVTQLGQATQACPSCPPYGAGAVSSFQYLPTPLSGPLIPEDGNVVMHCYGSDFNGTTLTCSRGGPWTTNGSIAGAATPPLYLNGFAASARSAMGPFSASNYFSLGTGNDVLDFAGSYTLCVVFSYSTLASQYLVSDGAANSAGWVMQAGSGADGKFYFQQAKAGATVNTSPANTMAAGTVNIACGGTNGVNDFAMLNAGTVATNAIASPLTPATSVILTLGNSNTVLPFSGTIYEIYATTTAPTAGLMTSIEQTALTELGTRGEAMTFARPSSAAYMANGTLYTASVGAPGLGDKGLQLDDSTTNQALWARDFTQAAWVKTTMSATLTATGIDGAANSASTLTATGANATVIQTVTLGQTGFASCMSLRRRTGSGTVNVSGNGGGTWGAIALTGSYQRVTPDLVAALVTGAVNPALGIQITTSGDAVDVDYAQIESSGVCTTPIVTNGTAVTRNKTSVSFHNPFAGLISQPFCLQAKVTPLNNWADFEYDLVALNDGAFRSANSASFYATGNRSLVLETIDGTGTNSSVTTTSSALWANDMATHQFQACNVGGVTTIYLDGASTPVNAPTGGGTGIIAAMPNGLWVGTQDTTGTQRGTAQTQNVCVARKAGVCK